MSPPDRIVACVPLIVPSPERMHTKETRRERRRVHLYARKSGRLEKLSVQRLECGRVKLRTLFPEPPTLIWRQRRVRTGLIDRAAKFAVLHEAAHDAPIT